MSQIFFFTFIITANNGLAPGIVCIFIYLLIATQRPWFTLPLPFYANWQQWMQSKHTIFLQKATNLRTFPQRECNKLKSSIRSEPRAIFMRVLNRAPVTNNFVSFVLSHFGQIILQFMAKNRVKMHCLPLLLLIFLQSTTIYCAVFYYSVYVAELIVV